MVLAEALSRLEEESDEPNHTRREQMMNDTLALLHREVLAAYQQEYEELLEHSANLDRKAGALAAISGLFLAAIFAFARQGEIATFRHVLWSFVASLGLLFAAVTSCLLAARLRSRLARPGGSLLREMVTDLKSTGPTPERLRRFHHDQIACWDEAVESLRKSGKRKSVYIQAAELLVLLSTMAMGVTTILTIIS